MVNLKNCCNLRLIFSNLMHKVTGSPISLSKFSPTSDKELQRLFFNEVFVNEFNATAKMIYQEKNIGALKEIAEKMVKDIEEGK